MMSTLQRAHAVQWKDIDRWVVPKHLLWSLSLSKGWSLVRVKDLVTQVTKRVPVERDSEYNMLGVRWYGEGTFVRETVSGDTISASYVYPAVPGALIYNRLFAWKGAFAVVPPEHSDGYVSNEFPQFLVDASRVLPEYLFLVFTRSRTLRVVHKYSVGSAAVSRNRFNENEFMDFEVPIPPLTIQSMIVEQWRRAQEEIREAEHEVVKVTQDLNLYLMSLYHSICTQDVLKNRWLILSWKDLSTWDVKGARASAFRVATPGFEPLGNFAEEATELVKPWEELQKEWPVYGVNNKEGVVFTHFQRGEKFNVPYKRIRQGWFLHNPTRAVVGSLGIVPEVPEDAITSPEYQVWRIKQGLIPGYVATLVRTPFFLNLIQINRTGAVKERLYTENLLRIRIPVLPESEQRRFAEARDKAMDKLARVKSNTKLLDARLEAMIFGKEPVAITV